MQFWSLRSESLAGPDTDSCLVTYAQALKLQKKLVDLRASDEIPDTVLFLEHPPVITRGRGLQFTGAPRPRHMPVPVLLPDGIEFVDSERGGDLTYHGPGQLVVYPVFKLDGSATYAPKHDVGAFLRGLEKILITELTSLGLLAKSRENATGVWVGERKLVSIGIAVRKWVTYHGAAINVVNDLQPFHLISPCGFDPEVMTRLSDLLPESGLFEKEGSWRAQLEQLLAQRWSDAQASVEVRKVSDFI